MKTSKFLNYISIFIVIMLLIAQIINNFYTFEQWIKYTMLISACVLFVLNLINIFIFKKSSIKSQIWSIGPTFLLVIYWLFICL